ncbi:MAG: STM4015 family protein [Verrucomicrobiales bacterium]|nr:STM4015 family protein [Verrucomicrobiales bacterium]
MPVKNWKPADGTPEFSKYIYRIGFDWEDSVDIKNSLAQFFSFPGVEETIGLSLGANTEECSEFYKDAFFLIENKAKLPNLKALFLAECDQEESEISWIGQGDISPFLEAFPLLEDFRARGCEGFTATPLRHNALKKLVIESGGLAKSLLKGVHESIFPELEHLELWLGTEEYGWDGKAEDTKPLLYENAFSKLSYLGLKNSDEQDEIAKLAAEAPVLGQLKVLDLSLGVLKNAGGEALLASEAVQKLEKLDLHHHFMGTELMARFVKLFGTSVDVSGREEPDTYGDEIYYYIAVSE